MKARLVFLTGKRKGETITLSDEPIVVGRDESNIVVLDDDNVSRRHCVIRKSDSHYEVTDLKSTNGTFVNGLNIDGPCALSFGDEITVGHLRLLFTASDTDSRKPSELAPLTFAAEEKLSSSNIFELHINKCATKILDTGAFEESSPEAKAVQNLVTIYEVGNAVHSVQELSKLLDTILTLVFDVVRADTGVILLVDEESGELIPKTSRSRLPSRSRQTLAISHTIAQKVLEGATSVLTSDALFDERFKTKESVLTNGIRSALCVPLLGEEKVMGLMYVDNHSIPNAFGETDLRLLTAIGIQAGIAIENLILFEEKRDMLLGAIRALVASEEVRDPYTRGHSERVAATSIAIAMEAGLDAETVSKIELAALLHDVGKLAIPDSILQKPSKVNPDEMDLIRSHPTKGAEIIRHIKGVEEIARAVRHHHERFDGEGYPDGLTAAEIPLASRIIALADAYDAMTSDRPYRGAMSQEKTLQEIERSSKKQFDERLVNALMSILRDGKVPVASGTRVDRAGN